MNLSTHDDRRQHPTIWSIGLIIAASALLAALIEPHYPTLNIAAHSDTSLANLASKLVDPALGAPSAPTYTVRTVTTAHR